MAVLNITRNRVAERLQENRDAATRKLVSFGLPIVAILSLAVPAMTIVWLLAWVVGLLSAKNSSKNVILAAGAEGEQHTLEVLSYLSDEYTVYNQVPLPNSRTGNIAEADFVVLGPNGVFIVENKEYCGIPVGDADSDKWSLLKVGKGGTRYTTSATNPIRQVKRHTAILSGFFKDRGIKVWVTPLVALSKNNRVDRVNSPKVPVLPVWKLNTTIVEHSGKVEELVLRKLISF